MNILKNGGIITKFVIYVTCIVLLLLFIGGTTYFKFELNMVKKLTNNFLNHFNTSIDKRLEEEQENLRKEMLFNANVLKGLISPVLYEMNKGTALAQLKYFMTKSEILLIEILDDRNNSFAASWKNESIKVSNELPKNIIIDERFCIKQKCEYKTHYVGIIKICYTDKFLIKKINKIKNESQSIINNLKTDTNNALNNGILYQSIGIGFSICIFIICLILLLKFIVIKPVKMVSEVAKQISSYDLCACINSNKNDEIGKLLNAIQGIIGEFNKVVFDVRLNGSALSNESKKMLTIAGKLSQNSDNLNDKSNKMKETAEENSDNIRQIAMAAEEMSNNVNNIYKIVKKISDKINYVAISIEKMSSSMYEAGSHVKQNSKIAVKTVENAKEAVKKMTVLDKASNEIGSVTDLIKRIAHKTNLLALNATIEAASAGEAGKGFAVVADAIQIFAEQSNKAAEDIAKIISDVQENTSEASKTIKKVTKNIEEINDSTGAVYDAVEKQSTIAMTIAVDTIKVNSETRDIENSIKELSFVARDISQTVVELAKYSNDATENIQSVNQATINSSLEIKKVHNSAKKLDKFANDLYEIVSKFKINN